MPFEFSRKQRLSLAVHKLYWEVRLVKGRRRMQQDCKEILQTSAQQCQAESWGRKGVVGSRRLGGGGLSRGHLWPSCTLESVSITLEACQSRDCPWRGIELGRNSQALSSGSGLLLLGPWGTREVGPAGGVSGGC